MKNLILVSIIILSFSCKKQDIELKSFTIGGTIVSTQRTKAIKKSINEAQIVLFLNQEVSNYLNGLNYTTLDIILQDEHNIASLTVADYIESSDCDKGKTGQVILYLGFATDDTGPIVITLKSASTNVLNKIVLIQPGSCEEIQLNMSNKLV